MAIKNEKETKGAWIVHHARKILMDVNAPVEYPVLDEAGKAASLLMCLSASDDATLTNAEVEALASAAKLNPRAELPHYLDLLTKRRLIEKSQNEVQVLGVNARGVLSHAADIFDASEPNTREQAAIELGELTSHAPLLLSDAKEFVSDKYKMKTADSGEFIRRASEIGFVDQEGDDPSITLLFNGNLFKRNNVEKAAKVLESLSSAEQAKVTEITELLKSTGCQHADICENRLGRSLFEKLKAAGVVEVNTVSNENGEHAFVTLPDAFHKFVDPLIDDSFDMAKALVSALSYGMHLRRAWQGQIINFDWILNALISGRTIGPATAIGADYRVLEERRVISLTAAGSGMYKMKLLKKEIGELALQVLKRGDANAESINTPPGAPMSGYSGPESSREKVRRQQSRPSKNHTHDILSALRGQRVI